VAGTTPIFPFPGGEWWFSFPDPGTPITAPTPAPPPTSTPRNPAPTTPTPTQAPTPTRASETAPADDTTAVIPTAPSARQALTAVASARELTHSNVESTSGASADRYTLPRPTFSDRRVVRASGGYDAPVRLAGLVNPVPLWTTIGEKPAKPAAPGGPPASPSPSTVNARAATRDAKTEAVMPSDPAATDSPVRANASTNPSMSRLLSLHDLRGRLAALAASLAATVAGWYAYVRRRRKAASAKALAGSDVDQPIEFPLA
jgi:large repetitive protein